MRYDASFIILLVLLGNALLLGSAAVRYMCTGGSPLAVKHRLWINFVSYLLMTLLVWWAMRHEFNLRQLWFTGGYAFAAYEMTPRYYITLDMVLLSLLSMVVPNCLMFGFWSGNGRVVYTTMVTFIVWHIVIGIIGYIFSSEIFTY